MHSLKALAPLAVLAVVYAGCAEDATCSVRMVEFNWILKLTYMLSITTTVKGAGSAKMSVKQGSSL